MGDASELGVGVGGVHKHDEGQDGLTGSDWSVNPKDVKHLPGRPKTDRLGTVWLCKVAEPQMLRPSFMPPPIRELRSLNRYRGDCNTD